MTRDHHDPSIAADPVLPTICRDCSNRFRLPWCCCRAWMTAWIFFVNAGHWFFCKFSKSTDRLFDLFLPPTLSRKITPTRVFAMMRGWWMVVGGWWLVVVDDSAPSKLANRRRAETNTTRGKGGSTTKLARSTRHRGICLAHTDHARAISGRSDEESQ
jgi:hypothetical protein